MNSPGQQLVHLVLTLAFDDELDILPKVISGEQLAVARELGALIQGFNYLNSVAFEDLILGKSSAVVSAWRRRLMEPVKRKELKEEFYGQVRRILTGGEMEKYLPASAAAQVNDIRRKLKALNAV
jgi:hypothetical protein